MQTKFEEQSRNTGEYRLTLKEPDKQGWPNLLNIDLNTQYNFGTDYEPESCLSLPSPFYVI